MHEYTFDILDEDGNFLERQAIDAETLEQAEAILESRPRVEAAASYELFDVVE